MLPFTVKHLVALTCPRLSCTSAQKQLTIAVPLQHLASLDCQEGMAEMDSQDLRDMMVLQDLQDVMGMMVSLETAVQQEDLGFRGHQG